jgi:hypothetical protein
VQNKPNSSIADCELNDVSPGRVPEGKCAEQTQFRSAEQSAGRARPTHEETNRAKRTQFGPARRRNVQNEAKLGGTGVCGQRQSPGGTWLSRGVKRAKRTQFGPGGHGGGGERRRTASLQTGETVQNEPNFGRDAAWARGSRGTFSLPPPRRPPRSQLCRTKPIWRAPHIC